MRVVDFEIDHLLDLPIQEAQRHEDPRRVLQEHMDLFAAVAVYAWSLECEDEIVGCLGMVPYPEYWMAWAMLSDQAIGRKCALTKTVRRLIENVGPEDKPLLATPAFPNAARWLKVLGFRPLEEGVWEWLPQAQ